ncbi:tRNA(adenine(34)) deaminase, chloroplastic [Pistacia vera]|uniref:tRNA(adenine(34)) deaminase, chloroplastic n=1 Tax=Pistacia vera TaxID=55513 RepID=UPI0012635D76|nr:tRNA(adenine(34)) deaminase, chloroplastic [Pistacia vera]
MHNAYFSSTLLSLKSKGSLSFSFNDYSSLLNERFDRNSLASSCSCCCCSCCCCAFASHGNRVPTSPGFLYGLRQSTLIQCLPSRRLILGSGDRLFYRVPVYNGCNYEVSCSIKERNGSGSSFDRRRKGRFRCMVSEERSRRYRLGEVDDAEAIINLLSEEVSEEHLGGRERNERIVKRVETEKGEDYGSEFYRGKKNRVEVEKRGSYGGECSRRRKKNVGLNLLKGDNYKKCEFESTAIELREEEYRVSKEREAITREENRSGRNKSSSCSSYYSFSSSGEYGSDEEVQDKEGQYMEESFSGLSKDSSRSEEERSKAQVVEEFNRHSSDEVGHDKVPEWRYTAAGSCVEWDCRKKSEKKLTEVSVEETQSKKESSQIHLKMDRRRETEYGKASTSCKQFDDVDEKLTLAVNVDKGTRKLYDQMGTQDTEQPESRNKWQEVRETKKINASDVEMTSQSQKRFSGREEKLTSGEYHQAVGLIHSKISRDSQQLTKTPETLDVDTEKISNLQSHSESRMNIRKEDTTLVQSSVQGRKEQYQQSSEKITGQNNLRRKAENFSRISETHDTNRTKTSIIQSEARSKNQEENSRLVSISHPEKKDQRSLTDHEHHQRTQSIKGSKEVTSVSVVHASDMKTYTESQKNSERRVVNQEIFLTSVVKPTRETRERHNQKDEGAVQTKTRKEAQKPTGLRSSHEYSLEENSSSRASLDLVSQTRVQQFDVEEGLEEVERNSQVISIPPSSQLVARGSLYVDPTSGVAFDEVSGKSSESGLSALYTHSEGKTSSLCDESYVIGRQEETYEEPLNFTTHEDALGSVHRLEESSMQFVGEFVEKARHEVSTSEIQTDKNTAVSKVVSEADKQWKKNSGQYGSEDFQLKGREPRQSSEGSGAKGPSDEMWDVTDPSVQHLQSGAPEGSKTAGNAVVKRRGRSFWNIMGDIVRLRWGSQVETPIAAARSDEKSPSNESVGSETWFSGRESDKHSDENVKRERSSMPQEAAPSYQLQLGKTFTQTQGETSDAMGSKNKERHREAVMASSSSTIEVGSSSRGSSSAFEEEHLVQKGDGNANAVQGIPSGVEVEPSLSCLSAKSTRRSPIVEEISETGKIDETRSSSMVQLAQPFSARLTEVSGSPGKGGELKQRKLQRNKQVLKDRFDEWEEAYKLETDQRNIDEMFMREALLEAKKAADTWEVPVGAVLVQHGKIIARGCNLVEELRDSTAHAEMICIREASNVLQTWRLAETTLYVTLEPCAMCAGAILQARISTLVWGAPNKLLGADGSWVRLFPNGGDGSEPSDKPAAPVHPFHPKMTIRRGVLASDCAEIMQQFFQLRRRKKEKNPETLPPPSCLPIASQPTKILTKMQHMFNLMFCL